MIKLAIVGFGQHVQKNILPALLQIPDLIIVCVYVRNPDSYVEMCERVGLVARPIEALGEITVDYTYVATPLSTHFNLARKSLYAGSNVICEKPLTDSPSKTSELFKVAAAKNLSLYEVCMYRFHKQYRHLKNLIDERRSDIRSVQARFMVPHLDQRNIRYNASLGGGALFDVGYYPISRIRIRSPQYQF